MLVAVPAGALLRAHEHERDLPALDRAELARVLDDDAHAARQLQVVDEERDLHARGSPAGGSEPCPGASSPPGSGAAALVDERAPASSAASLAASAPVRSGSSSAPAPESGRPSSRSSS